MQIYLNCFHFNIRIECLEESIINKLNNEFFHFIQDDPLSPAYELKITSDLAPTIPRLHATKILENKIIFDTATERFVQYQKSLLIQNKITRSAILYSQHSDEAYEIAFLYIHSLLGKDLDFAGVHRIHAVGINYQNKNALIMLPSKGGKSTLLSYLIEDEGLNIISDDMPLIDQQGLIHPFPSKLSMTEIPTHGPLSKLHWETFNRTLYPPKYTASLSQLSSRLWEFTPVQENILICGLRLSSSQGELVSVNKLSMIKPLVEHMIFGFGLPQVLEFFLSFNWKDLVTLPYIAFKRILAAYHLLKRSKTYYLYLGTDKERNAKLIRELLYAK